MKYTLNKFDYFYYLMLFWITFIFIKNFNLLNFNNIIPLMGSLSIIYFLILSHNQKQLNIFYKENNTYEKVNFKKYPYLSHDDEIIKLVVDVKQFYGNNLFNYNNLLFKLNYFIYKYKKFVNNPNKNIYKSLRQISVDIINLFDNIGVNLDLSKFKNLDHLVFLEKKLKLILSKYLTQFEVKNNNNWNKLEINNTDSPIYPDDINGLDKMEYNAY